MLPYNVKKVFIASLFPLLPVLVSAMALTLSTPSVAMAAPPSVKIKAPMSDGKLKKALEPIDKTLGDLFAKVQAHYLFGPEDRDSLTQAQIQLQDLMVAANGNPLLAKNLYQAGYILSRREFFFDAFDLLSYVTTQYPDSPFSFRSKVEIAQMKKLVGPQYFADALAVSTNGASATSGTGGAGSKGSGG
jgi:hypothetical protein